MNIESIRYFWKRQRGELAAGGTQVIWRKVRRSVVLGARCVYCIVLLPFAVLVVLLRPFVLVRFGELDSDRIGHFVYEPEFYLMENLRAPGKTGCFDVFYAKDVVCNPQLKRMLERVLRCWHVSRWVHWWLMRFPGGSAHTMVLYPEDGHMDVRRLFSDRPTPFIGFTPEEDAAGKAFLGELGTDVGGYVCLQNRDGSYLSNHLPLTDWSYHDYRDSQIEHYRLAVEGLLEAGLHVVRTGVVCAQELIVDHDHFHHYCGSPLRTDLRDLYLMAHCRFCISTGCGIDNVAFIFRSPVLYVNYSPMLSIPSHDAMPCFIPKTLVCKTSKQIISIRSMIEDYGDFEFYQKKCYDDVGLELVENSPDEIREAALEMAARVDGTWEEPAENLLWQRAIAETFRQKEGRERRIPPVCYAFLKKHPGLLAELAS